MELTNEKRLALAYLRLSREVPATPAVMHALTLIGDAMPVSGTEERREAFAWAKAQHDEMRAKAVQPIL